MEKLYISKLKIILNSNFFYFGCIVLAISLFLLHNFILKEVPKKASSSPLIGIITDYKINDGKTTLYLKGDTNSVITFYEELDVSYGAKVKVQGEEKSIENPTIPYAFSYKEYLYNKDIYTIVTGEYLTIIEEPQGIYWLKNKIRNRINQMDQKGYLLAFLLGDKSNIEKTTYENYSKIGVTHLFALSGMHVSILGGIILFLFKKKKKKNFIAAIFLLFYGVLVGFPSSLKRCILFFILNAINKTFHFGITPTKVLLLVFTLLVIQNDKILLDTGFLFSFFTVLGILSGNKWIISKSKFLSSCKLSVVAFFFSLPIAFYSFYSVNFLSILYNIFYIPFVSLLLYPLSLLTFLFPFLYPVFAFFLNVLEQVSFLLSKIDFLTLYLSFPWYYVVLYYTMLLLYVKYKKKVCIVISISLIFLKIILPYWDASGYVYFFDVGQGDSCLIISPYRKDVLLIDTGGITNYNKEPYYVSDNIITFLKHEGIRKINYLILSHGDYDHMGDATNLINNIKTEKAILNCGSYNNLEKELIKVLNKKNIEYYACVEELNIEDSKLYFLNTKEYDNENDNSNVIYTELNNYKFLFMGDAGIDKEKDILDKYNLKDIDFLKVGHHGSRTSSSKEFIDTIRPKHSVISVGKNNRYRHPNAEVLDNLDVSKIYRTDRDGSIEIKLNKNGYKIKTCNP